MEESNGSGVARQQIFDLLSNRRRRYAIHYCKRVGGPVSLSDLAEHVAAWEHGKTVDELTSAERKKVYTALQQIHLPTLERANVVEFEDHTVELTAKADQLDVYLDIVPADSIPWGVYYLGLAVLGFTVLAGVWVDFVPTGTVPELGWAALVLGVIAASAVVHVVTSRRYRLGDLETPP